MKTVRVMKLLLIHISFRNSFKPMIALEVIYKVLRQRAPCTGTQLAEDGWRIKSLSKYSYCKWLSPYRNLSG